MYTFREVMTYVEEEDVKFIRLTFCDVLGRQKNISIMPTELSRAFSSGISFDASAICGFDREEKSDLFLHPDPATLSILPWRPQHGRVVRMFCDITYPDGTPFERDGRYILKKAIAAAKEKGISFRFGAEFEFYLFRTDEDGEPTDVPFDRAGYLDIAPFDKGETVRREICFTLQDMGITPESSHHEEGPGQNEIDFRFSEALSAAENAVTFQSVVRTIAMRNGLYASFAPKPILGESGNGMHINLSVESLDGTDYHEAVMAGILSHAREMTAFWNPTEESYLRLGEMKAPRYVTWSPENRSQLIRIPAATGEYRRMELRSPDPTANPYLAYALIIYAALDGIERALPLPAPVNQNLYKADKAVTASLERLPGNLKEALAIAKGSPFIRAVLSEDYLSQL